jgi:hypothetical protein
MTTKTESAGAETTAHGADHSNTEGTDTTDRQGVQEVVSPPSDIMRELFAQFGVEVWEGEHAEACAHVAMAAALADDVLPSGLS